jgi:hypothetical protein
VPGRQVDREPRVAGPRIEHAGRADHERAQRVGRYTGAVACREHRAADQRHRILRVGGVDGDLGHHGARDVGDTGADLVLLDVQAGDVGARGDHRVQGRVRAAPACLLTRDSHQAALLEPGKELRRRDLGQPGVLTELRPGHRPAVEQQLKCGPVVKLPQQARRSRPSLHA